MAVAPLFLSTMDDLKARLRLSGVESTDDAQPLIDGATRRVRTQFYARLGNSQVAKLVAIPSVENPTTNEGILRALAEEVEEKWVWVFLAQRMPLKFFDNSGDDLEQYNQEGIFRSIDPDRVRETIEECMKWIEEMLPLLEQTVGLGENEAAKVHLQSDAAGGRIFPLGSLIGGNCRLWGNPKTECE